MSEDLIVVRQLPVIEERLRTISEQIRVQTDEALSLAVTEATVTVIKKTRAALKASFNELESQRKDVKRQVLEPYDRFEAVYRECVTNVFTPADNELKARIDEVENGLKDQKRMEAEAYFMEYAAKLGIDWLTFDRAGIKVGLSDTGKKLREQVKLFLDNVSEDLKLINIQPYPEEILVEYKRLLNPAGAVIAVTARHAEIEEEQKRAERRREAEAELAAASERVRAAATAPPVQVSEPTPEEEKLLRVRFTVSGTRDQLRALKKFLTDGGYDFE